MTEKERLLAEANKNAQKNCGTCEIRGGMFTPLQYRLKEEYIRKGESNEWKNL